MAVVTYYAVTAGNIARLKYGRDSEGNLCGSPVGVDSTRDLSSKPFLYYFNLTLSDTYRVCVRQCPNVTTTTQLESILCRYDVVPANTTLEKAQQIYRGECTYTFESREVFFRCIPTILLRAANSTSQILSGGESININIWGLTISTEFNARSVATKIFQDIYDTWWIILSACVLSLILSLLYTIFLQFFAAPLIYATLGIVLIASWGLAGYFAYNYYRVFVLWNGLVGTGLEFVDSQLYNRNVLLALTITTGVLAVILLLLICCARGRISLAIQVIKEASKATRALPTLLLIAPLNYILLLGLCAWFTYIYVMLSTSGSVVAQEVQFKIQETVEKVAGKQFKSDNILPYLQIYITFGFFWVYNWIVAIGQATVAGAVSMWYFSRENS
ncbi:hypothetical protein HK102_000001, partial [Quaeritorhiza haematococci]